MSLSTKRCPTTKHACLNKGHLWEHHQCNCSIKCANFPPTFEWQCRKMPHHRNKHHSGNFVKSNRGNSYSGYRIDEESGLSSTPPPQISTSNTEKEWPEWLKILGIIFAVLIVLAVIGLITREVKKN